MAGLVHSKEAGVFAVLADTELFGQVRVEHGVVRGLENSISLLS